MGCRVSCFILKLSVSIEVFELDHEVKDTNWITSITPVPNQSLRCYLYPPCS
jgi:hypothetical protein